MEDTIIVRPLGTVQKTNQQKEISRLVEVEDDSDIGMERRYDENTLVRSAWVSSGMDTENGLNAPLGEQPVALLHSIWWKFH